MEAERARTSSASFKSKGNELKRTSTDPVTLASPPGIKPWSLRSVGNVLDYGSSAALSLGGLFGSKEVFVGKRGDQETATGKSHQLGYLFGLQDMGHALLIFIGAPIVEWSLVTGRSGLGQQMDGVDLRSCLDVASLKLCDVVLVPECPLHIGKRLGIS